MRGREGDGLEIQMEVYDYMALIHLWTNWSPLTLRVVCRECSVRPGITLQLCSLANCTNAERRSYHGSSIPYSCSRGILSETTRLYNEFTE